MSEIIKSIIEKALFEPLSTKMAETAFNEIMSGNATDAQIAGFLVALKMRGETQKEIYAATKVMLKKCASVNAPKGAVDIVGTGGDGVGTLNISTAAALVVASAGAIVAKHGNKNISSNSGAANVLDKLGINIHAKPTVVEKCIRNANIGFMMAPIHHPAVKYVMPTRQSLGIRTIFNILGPLTNPAKVKYHLIGAYDNALLAPMAKTLNDIGSTRAWVVHGEDGTDEISITGKTEVVELANGKFSSFTVSPMDAGLPIHPLETILGGSPDKNAEAIKHLLAGDKSPYRDAVLFNSAAALLIAGYVKDLRQGVQKAKKAIDTGQTANTIAKLAKESWSE